MSIRQHYCAADHARTSSNRVFQNVDNQKAHPCFAGLVISASAFVRYAA